MVRLALRCRCGAVRGDVDGSRVINHVACYCADCRAFANRCGGDALDASGGTELLQVAADRVRLGDGGGLAALRVTARGPLRWRCAACDAAIATTWPTALLPYATIPVRSVAGEAPGPVRGAAFASSALGAPLHPPLGASGMAGMFARFGAAMLAARARGAHRRSSFHRDGRAIEAAPVMDPGERARLAAMTPRARGSSAG